MYKQNIKFRLTILTSANPFLYFKSIKFNRFSVLKINFVFR